MGHESYRNTSAALSPADDKDDELVPEDFVWSTSEEARLRALSLHVIQSIVERHGGTVHIDLATDTISINVPENERVACAQEIEEQVGSMCR